MGGTFDMASEPRVGLVRRFALLERSSCGSGVCTLLGPEGPGTKELVTVPLAQAWKLTNVGGWGWDRPYFENYTVDASIFKDDLLQPFGCNSCDFKSLRANGGCLGIWSRRRT